MAGSKKEKTLRPSGRRRRSMASSMQMTREAGQAASSYTLTGQLAVDLPLVAQQQGISFVPPVQTVVVPSLPTGQPAAEFSAEAETIVVPDAEPENKVMEPPPALISVYEQRLQAIGDYYQFYKPRVRLQLRANVAQQDPETGELSGPVHGVQVSGWRCEADYLIAMRHCFLALDSLSSLSLNNVALDEPAAQALALLLVERPNITNLNLDSNPGIGWLVARLLQSPANVKALSLRSCAITDDDIETLVPALTKVNSRSDLRFNSQPLRTLNLANNRLTSDGAATLARILRANRQLSSITLTRNRIGTEGAVALAHVLQSYQLTHEEVVQGRRARAAVRQEVVARVQSCVGRNTCCTGKCTHVGRRGCDADGSTDRSSAGSGRGARTNPRSGRSPARSAKPVEPVEPVSLESNVADIMSSIIHPLLTLVRPCGGGLVSPGNLVLARLSLAFNRRVGAPAATAFLATLRYQQAVPAEDASRLGPGLMMLSLAGTSAAGHPQLEALLDSRQPPLTEPEPPAEQEERPRPGRTIRQSEMTMDGSHMTPSRAGKQRKSKAK